MIRTTFSLAAILCAAVLPLSAQNKQSATVEIRMLAFTSELQMKEAFAQDPAAPESAASVPAPIKSYLNHQFSTMTLTSRKIVFTTKPERASLTHDDELIGEVTLPEGATSAILLFLPGKTGGKGRCQIMAINDSKRAFPAGSFHITNLSPLPIRLMLEKKIFDFKPGQTVLIEDPPVREGQMSGMRTFAFKNNAWAPVATSLWPHPGTARSLKVFYQNPASGDIQLMAFDDVPPRAPREQAATAKAQ